MNTTHKGRHFLPVVPLCLPSFALGSTALWMRRTFGASWSHRSVRGYRSSSQWRKVEHAPASGAQECDQEASCYFALQRIWCCGVMVILFAPHEAKRGKSQAVLLLLLALVSIHWFCSSISTKQHISATNLILPATREGFNRAFTKIRHPSYLPNVRAPLYTSGSRRTTVPYP